MTYSTENAPRAAARVYDILECGPRNRFWANGKIVSNCNLQNLPRGGKLRSSILAPEGHVIVVVDSAQIEARMLAWLADYTKLVQAFSEGRDVYREMAGKVFGVPEAKVDKVQRFVGKVCVAEGTPILTSNGVKPIEEITLEDKVWDGIEWVSHDGLVYNGVRNVITYQGLTATPDHGVYTREYGPLPLGIAASRLATLVTTGNGGEALRVSGDYFDGAHAPEEEHLRVRKMYELWQREMDLEREPAPRANSRLSELLANTIEALRGTWSKIRRNNRQVQQSEESGLQALRSSRNPMQFFIPHEFYTMGREESTASGLQRNRDRSQGQRRELQAGKSAPGYTEATNKQSAQYGESTVERGSDTIGGVPISVQHQLDVRTSRTTQANRRTNTRQARVYDLANAGPRRRFTAANSLIFNCVLGLGYGMGAAKLCATLASGGMGLKVDLSHDVCTDIVAMYRGNAYPIAYLWEVMNSILAHMTTGSTGTYKCLEYSKERLKLPNGLPLMYPGLNGWVHKDMHTGLMTIKDAMYKSRNSDKTRIYGGLLTENVVQALARIVIGEQMLEISKYYKVVSMTHDEIIIVAPEAEAELAYNTLLNIMKTPPAWATGLPLNAEGGYARNYSK